MPLKEELSVWRCLFGAVCLDLSVSCLFGAVCLELFVRSCLFGAVCLDLSVWTCLFACLEGAKNWKLGTPLNVFKTLMKPLRIDHFLALELPRH